MRKKVIHVLLLTFASFMSHADNIFLSEYKTTRQVIPFDKIDKSYYEEAVDKGIAEKRQQIDAITKQRSTPTFDNTIVALERSGETLNRVLSTLYPLISANSDEELMAISTRISPKLSELSTDIALNKYLWERIKYVYDHRDQEQLDTEDMKLLQETYDDFARSGALLENENREEYKALSAELSQLSLKYQQNALKALNQCEMWLSQEDLEGLPTSAIESYKMAAEAKGRPGEYLVTPSHPSYSPFMKYSSRRDLREKLYRLSNSRGVAGEYSNLDICKRIAEVRMKIAKLLGRENYAQYVLEKRMAQSPENVYKLLNQLKESYAPACNKELKEITEFARKTEGKNFKLMPWDYSYFSTKLKDAKYSINDEELRPYFELNNTIKGVFGLATRLYGLQFTQNDNYAVYHPEVKAFDVTDNSGNFIGVIYTDFFPRESKESGAWMTNFKEQYITEAEENSRPHVSIVMNFTKPTETAPSLLTYYEVETFLHEFGHALHGLLANTKYASLSGTNVYRDFVELPSQFNENYLAEKEFLDTFAKHYQTGEAMPQELIDKIVASSQFGAAYSCMRQLGFGFLDMAWHTATAPVDDVVEFEKNALKDVSVFDPVDGCLTSTQFSHIFSGGYAAGYYGYKWAEVLDADAFAAFKEVGIFNADKAESFKTNVLMKGGTEHPMTLYKRFRGSEPTIDALLIRDGIKKEKTKKTTLKVSKKD